MSLVLHWKPQAQFAGYYVGVEKGIYEARGLDVTVIPGGPDIDSFAELRAGRADFALGFLSGALSADDQGAPLVDVCQVSTAPTSCSWPGATRWTSAPTSTAHA